MRRLYLLMVCLAFNVCASQENLFYTIDVDGTTLHIPPPNNMLRITPEMGEAYQMLLRNDEQDINNHYYANYWDIQALQEGKERTCSISIPKKALRLQLSDKQFQEFKSIIAKEFKTILNQPKFREDVSRIKQKQLDINAETTGSTLLSLGLDDITVLLDDEQSYINRYVRSEIVKQLYRIETDMNYVAGGILLVKGKLLNINCNVAFNDEEKVWLEHTILDWKSNIIAANQQNVIERAYFLLVSKFQESGWVRFFAIFFSLEILRRLFKRFKRN